MLVKQLIEKLSKCNPDDIVMYNFENAFTNDNYERMNVLKERHFCEFDCSVDELKIGSGTSRGFVFLQEELLKD